MTHIACIAILNLAMVLLTGHSEGTKGPPCGGISGDLAAVASTKARMDGACPCEQASSKKTYARCAQGVIKATIETSQLRKQCKSALRPALKATCG